jgi:hypothetical protein
VFFNTHDFGSATLEFSIFSASLSKLSRAHSVLTREELISEPETVERRSAMRRLAGFVSPFQHSLLRLHEFHKTASERELMGMLKDSAAPVSELCRLVDAEDGKYVVLVGCGRV